MTPREAETEMTALKQSLRKSMLRTLRGISRSEIEQQSQAVARIVFDSPFYREAKSIACYLSMPSGELQTHDIVEDALSTGKRLYVPYLPPTGPPKPDHEISPDRESTTQQLLPDMQMLRLYNKEDLNACPLDKWGIVDPGRTRKDVGEETQRENVASQPIERYLFGPLDVILLPGVAFDAECNRLGRGKAFYDRFLYSYTKSGRRPLLIALSLQQQMLTEQKVPTTETDFQLDGVISPAGLVWRQKSFSGSGLEHES